MKEYRKALKKLRRDAAKNRIVAHLTINKAKRDTFNMLARHLDALADEVERAMPPQQSASTSTDQKRDPR